MMIAILHPQKAVDILAHVTLKTSRYLQNNKVNHIITHQPLFEIVRVSTNSDLASGTATIRKSSS